MARTKYKRHIDWLGFAVRFFFGAIIGGILAFSLSYLVFLPHGKRATIFYEMQYTQERLITFISASSFIFGLLFGFFYKDRFK
jgi:hypothetical protein